MLIRLEPIVEVTLPMIDFEGCAQLLSSCGKRDCRFRNHSSGRIADYAVDGAGNLLRHERRNYEYECQSNEPCPATPLFHVCASTF